VSHRRAAPAALAIPLLVALSAAPAIAAEPVRAAHAPISELSAPAVTATPRAGEIRRFRQRLGGYPVFGAAVTVADPGHGPATLVVDRTVAGIERPPTPRVGRRAAIATARARSGADSLRAVARARLGIDPASKRLAWRVLLPSRRPLADYEVMVDARSGEAVSSHDLLRRATGSAAIFDPNAVVTHGSSVGLHDRQDRNSRLLRAQRVPVELPNLTGSRGCLHGAYVSVRLGPKSRRVCKRSLRWSVGRSADRFEALMAYFHVDRTRTYLESLGLEENGLRDGPIRVDADAILADNSYYSPLGHDLTFGTGGVDDAEDGDVITHEYGHAVQDQQVARFGRRLQGASMGEGFGDYLAAVMSSVTTGGDPDFDPCMFEWDATSYTRNRCARRTDSAITKKRAVRRCFGDPHCIGEAWSGALWELRALLGADVDTRVILDRVLIESHLMLAANSNFRDGARALIAADGLLYAGAHGAAIEAEMVQRRFCPSTGC
jgi:hypothetical protein